MQVDAQRADVLGTVREEAQEAEDRRVLYGEGGDVYAGDEEGTVKIFEPPLETELCAVPARFFSPTKKKRPRCMCGCGKAAYWPREGKPVFHTRLCGYLLALKMVKRKRR